VLITNHVLAGALIGRATRAPASAFALGIVSHLVMDVTPHWGDADMTVFLRVARVDGLLGLAMIAAMVATTSPTQRRSVLAGITGACLPDLDKPARHLVGRRAFPVSVERWLADIQHESPRRMPVEFTAGAVLALGWFRPRRYGGVVD
jgi:hypothetical protein